MSSSPTSEEGSSNPPVSWVEESRRVDEEEGIANRHLVHLVLRLEEEYPTLVVPVVAFEEEEWRIDVFVEEEGIGIEIDQRRKRRSPSRNPSRRRRSLNRRRRKSPSRRRLLRELFDVVRG